MESPGSPLRAAPQGAPGSPARAGASGLQTPLATPWPEWLAAARGAAPGDARLRDLDVVVIGSGYGGSVAALRMAEQGRRVLVLERGSEFLPGEFPNHVGQLTKYLRGPGPRGPIGSLGGLFEVRSGAGMASIVANGLGGGSLINAGVLMRPDADVFAQPHWPAALRHATDARGSGGQAPLGLDAAFDRAAGMLGGELFHDRGQPAGAVSALPKAQALARIGRALAKDAGLAKQTGPAATLDFEARPARVTISLDACTRCGDCFSGCNVPGAKKTLATTYLGRAVAAGAQLVTRCLVYTLAPVSGGRGWTLRVLATEDGNHARTLADVDLLHGTALQARTVVVAAGTFGSTELLMRSTRRAGGGFRLSPRLGQRLSGNGDGLSAIADLEPAPGGLGHGAQTLGDPAPVGPTITTVLDLRGHPSIEQRVVLQEGATPGAMVGLYREILATAWTLRQLGQPPRDPRGRPGSEPLGATPEIALHAQMLLTMGHDGSAGEIVWKAGRDAAVPCWTRPEEAATHRRQQQLFDAADRSAGGLHLHTPAWQVLSPRLAALLDAPVAPPTLLSVHPLGGCAMADSFEQGVVDDRGRVWQGRDAVWPGLLVLDGSIVPTSLGCNPLWTITALAERAMACLAAEVPADDAPPTAPPGLPLPTPVPRDPRPLARKDAPVFDYSIGERLEKAALELRGPLRRALGLAVVESDLRVYMRHPDFASLWDSDGHRVHHVEGRLRLVEIVGELGERTTPRRLEYRIDGGHVDLLTRPPWWTDPGSLRRVLRTVRVGITWFLLRGQRDWGRSEFRFDLAKGVTLLRLAWQAAELRHVRYDLALALRRDRLPAGARPPATLRLSGVKVITYAASWTEIARHWIVRWWQKRKARSEARRARAEGRVAHTRPTGLGWDAPGRRHPADLRASLLHQLTEPMVRLDTARWRAFLPAWLVGATKGRFAFDQQEGLQRSPARLLEGGDSSAAALALLAYPAFVVRFLLQTRLLEFRLPDYSGRPVTDTASPADVSLRIVLGDGRGFCLAPEEIALHVPRGDSSSDDGDETCRPLHLRLWRYRRIDLDTGLPLAPALDTQARWCGQPVRRARSVLLTHAFDMSGLAYTFKTTDRNFAEHLYAQGWEVWVLDSRMSPRTTASREPCTVDQLGMIDAPAAVDHILATLNRESHTAADTAAPLQIFGFGQCMGAASFLIGLLAGRLSYRHVLADPAFASATGERPVLPKLAGLVTSQTHPFVVGARDAQAKIWVPALLRDLDGRSLVPLSVRGPVERDVEAMADRLFAGLPVPPDEHCHGEGERERHDDDDCVTCRRVRFLLGSMFKHRELNWHTHRELPRLFGAGSVRLFAQGAKFFGYERLTSEDGFNVYATDAAMGRYLALPIRFMHGALNGLFDQESATRSASQYGRIHPGWAEAFGLRVERSHPDGAARQQGQWRVCDVIEGYGHLDVLIGKRAMLSVEGEPSTYARLGALLEQAWSTPHAAPVPPKEDTVPAPRLSVRFPKAGPFFGPPIVDAGERTVRVAFIVDDSSAEAPGRGHGGVAALVWSGGSRSRPALVALALTELPVAIPARDGFVPCAVEPAIGLRIAHGRIAIPADGSGGPLRIECVSYTPTCARPADGAATAAAPAALPSIGELCDAIGAARRRAAHQRRDADRPFPSTVSAQRRRPPNGSQRNALVAAQLLDDPGPDGPVRIAIGCCRYGGFPIDRHRADASFRRLDADLRDGSRSADLLFMLGDQIYADRSAGLADPTSPTERFLHRHQEAFTTPALRRLMARLPTVCLPDDHEYVDGFPLGRPLVRPAADDPVGGRQRNDRARAVAAAAVSAYQLMQLPATAREQGWCAFERGGVRFFVLDTRSARRRHRRGTVSTLSPVARKAFAAWVRSGAAGNGLSCLATASVVMPGLVPESNPAQAGVPDSMQAAPHERRWMLGLLVARLPGRFVLLAGDYHLSLAAELRRGDETVGAVVLAPPFYAPLVYANCPPSDIWLGERIATPAGELTLRLAPGTEPRAGSGHGVLDMQRRDGRWEVRLSTTLTDFELGGGACEHAWPAVRL